jgi:hypothetical protein
VCSLQTGCPEPWGMPPAGMCWSGGIGAAADRLRIRQKLFPVVADGIGMLGGRTWIAMVLLALLPSVAGQEPAKILVMGNPGNIRVVANWLEGDPLADPRQVPARTHLTDLQGSDIQRFIRLYFPRNYEQMLEYEYIMLVMLEVFHLTDDQQSMIYNAMYKDGRGGFQDRSVMSMAEYIAHAWAQSFLSEAFPSDAQKVVSQKFYHERMYLRHVINNNPNVPKILSPYRDFEGVETAIAVGTTCIAIPRDGAVVTSYIIGDFNEGYAGAYPDSRFKSPGWMPHSLFWEYGNATTWTHNDMLGGDLYWNPAHNPYSIDMLLAEFMFATGRDLPEDVVLVHFLRGKFGEYSATKGFIYSILDFVDKFGASGTPITNKVQEINAIADEGKSLYLRQDYIASSQKMDGAIAQMEALRGETMKLKDRALFWVYVTEWLAVSGVALIAGAGIWTLMVRRRLYREVTVTRLGAAE